MRSNYYNLPESIECNHIYVQPIGLIKISIPKNNKEKSTTFMIDIKGNNCQEVQSILQIQEILQKDIYKRYSKIKNLKNSDIYLE